MRNGEPRADFASTVEAPTRSQATLTGNDTEGAARQRKATQRKFVGLRAKCERDPGHPPGVSSLTSYSKEICMCECELDEAAHDAALETAHEEAAEYAHEAAVESAEEAYRGA
jgi:hypothetical protein